MGRFNPTDEDLSVGTPFFATACAGAQVARRAAPAMRRRDLRISFLQERQVYTGAAAVQRWLKWA